MPPSKGRISEIRRIASSAALLSLPVELAGTDVCRTVAGAVGAAGLDG
ncbi:hypothetical protein ACN9MB_12030 [Dyella kyungheensis]